MTVLATEPAPFTTEEHWRFLGEFVHEETALGGPDPHLATLGPMLRGLPGSERVWRCCLYASGYNIPLAEAIWSLWPLERAATDRSGLEAWVHGNWSRFTLRRERRAVRTPVKFNRMLQSMLDWIHRPESLALWDNSTSFEDAWVSTGKIYGLGRYVQQKLIEAFVRHTAAPFAQSDIRARDGTSPREGLALLYPQHAHLLIHGGNGPEAIRAVEELARDVRFQLVDKFGAPPHFDFFQLQVVLCEYKKSWQGKQYPGRTHDTELRYFRDAQEKWGGYESTMLAARAEVFPEVILGEKQGWWRQREELEDALPVYKYTWTDLKFNFWLSTVANPMPW